MLFGMEDQKSDVDDIIGWLETTGVEFVEKRVNGGSLWIISDYELAETVRKAKALGCIFHFKKEGGRATKNKPGWWAKWQGGNVITKWVILDSLFTRVHG